VAFNKAWDVEHAEIKIPAEVVDDIDNDFDLDWVEDVAANE
jgi:hypothetical protein